MAICDGLVVMGWWLCVRPSKPSSRRRTPSPLPQPHHGIGESAILILAGRYLAFPATLPLYDFVFEKSKSTSKIEHPTLFDRRAQAHTNVQGFTPRLSELSVTRLGPHEVSVSLKFIS